MALTGTDIFKRLWPWGGNYRDTTGIQRSGPDVYGNNAGIPITDDTAMSLSAVWACVRLTAEIIASLPLHVYQKTDDGRIVADQHQLYRVLHRKPNRYQTSVEFWETMVLQLALYGNAYAIIDRNNKGEVTSLVPMYAQSMCVHLEKDGSVLYEYSTEGSTQIYAEESILHIRLMGPGPVVGLSPLKHARNALGLASTIENHTSKFFANGARPAGVLKLDQFLKPEQKKELRKRFEENYSGSENAFKLFLLEGGMEYQATTISPEDAQLIELAGFSVEEICRYFRVPPQLIGQTDKASSWASSLENLNLYFLQYTIDPYLTRIEKAINAKLFNASDRMNYYAEFTADALLRTDAKTRSEVYSSAINNGWMTRNEVRKRENLPEVEGGDVLTMQVNQTGLSENEPE